MKIWSRNTPESEGSEIPEVHRAVREKPREHSSSVRPNLGSALSVCKQDENKLKVHIRLNALNEEPNLSRIELDTVLGTNQEGRMR